MRDKILFPFYNREEGRVRALWRLLLQLGATLIVALPLPAVAIMMFVRARGLPFEGIPFTVPTPIAEQTIAETPWMNMLVITLSGIGASATVWLAGKYLDKRPFADFGLHIDRTWWEDLAAGAVIGALLAGLVFAIEWALGWVTVTETFYSSLSGIPFAAAFVLPLLFFVGIAVNEELVVRGYMLKNSAEGMNFRFLGKRAAPRVALLLALVVTALNFGLGHTAFQLSTMNITLAGVWLALAYILTGELAMVFGIHLTWNLFQGNVFGFPVSGVVFDPTSVLVIEQAGPELWTGGSYGPEAGLMGTLAFGLGIVMVLVWVRVKRGRVALKTEMAEYGEGNGTLITSDFTDFEIGDWETGNWEAGD